jgi:hypothetical protein
MMADHGFGGPPLRLQQLKLQLRMTINTILDQLVHCAGLTEADGMALMTGRGLQEEGEAAGKWRRALLTSTQLSEYRGRRDRGSPPGRRVRPGLARKHAGPRRTAAAAPARVARRVMALPTSCRRFPPPEGTRSWPHCHPNRGCGNAVAENVPLFGRLTRGKRTLGP